MGRKAGAAALLLLLLSALPAPPAAAATPQGPFEAALRAYRQGDYTAARRLWEEALAAEDWEAARSLGTLYRRGLGVPADAERAVDYYRLAVAHGVVAAEPNLAEMLIAGQGAPPDPQMGKALLAHAADHGSLPARLRLEDIDEAESRDLPIPALPGAEPLPAPPAAEAAASPPEARAQVAIFPDEEQTALGWLSYNLPGLMPELEPVVLPDGQRIIRLWARGPAATVRQLCAELAAHSQGCPSVDPVPPDSPSD